MNRAGGTRPRLSLCMIVRNEERFLDGCLESVRGIADEIIVVDTGSTDATQEIARRYGARIFSFDWCDDFSAARNESLRHAAGRWILYLDADERIVPGQEQAIRELLSDRSAGGFILWVEGDHHLPGHTVRHRNGYPRLFRNDPAIRFAGKVHEQISPSIERRGLPIRMSGVTIEHLGYGQSYEIVAAKAERNLAMLRRQAEADPRDGYTLFQIGNTLDVLERYDEARPVIEQALTLRLSESVRSAAETILAGIAIRQQRPGDAVEAARRSIALSPDQQIARWFLGIGLMESGAFAEAIATFEEILRLSKEQRHGRVTAHDVLIDDWKVLFHLGQCHERMGSYEQAAECYAGVVLRNPAPEDPWNGLFRVELHCADAERSTARLSRLLETGRHTAELWREIARQHRRAGRREAARAAAEECERRDPADELLHAMRLEWALEEGPLDAAAEILDRARTGGGVSFGLYKRAVDEAVRRGNLPAALKFLREMTDTIPERIPSELRPRFEALLARLSAVVAG